jgi:hypothetical protein
MEEEEMEVLFENYLREDYERIKCGKRLNEDCVMYSITYIDEMISFFEREEEYEKCNIILDTKNKILNHQYYYSNILV